MSRQHIFGITSPGGFRCALIDFTNAGGRAPRDFIYELGGDSFMGIYIAPGDDIYPPTANPVLTMAAVGDSYPARLGVMTSMWAYPQLAGDAHGIRNVINTAIGACGYADGLCASRGVLARISEVTGINGGNGPDVILLSNGTNDMAAGEPRRRSRLIRRLTSKLCGPTDAHDLPRPSSLAFMRTTTAARPVSAASRPRTAKPRRSRR